MNPEITASSLLTRDDITTILNERHLKIPNIELMAYEDLLRIYETFAHPLEKRHSRRSTEIVVQQPASAPQSAAQPLQSLSDSFHANISLNENIQVNRVFANKSHDPHDFPPTKYLKLSFNTVPSVGGVAKKRSNGITINAAQEATPSKRKPITWP